MEKQEHEAMFEMEEDYWWYRGLRDALSSSIGRFAGQYSHLRILDAGCGTGKLMETYKSYNIYGLEFSEEAFKFLKVRGLKKVVRGSICAIPFKNQTFDLVISLDVLSHVNVKNDEDTLSEIYNVIEPGGMFILNLPAFESLQSEHDAAVHTIRRYTKKEIKKKLERAGFDVQMITYRNMILFPVAVVLRLIKGTVLKRTCIRKSDLSPLPGWVNQLFYKILIFENRVLMKGVILPFGLSVFCIARKK